MVLARPVSFLPLTVDHDFTRAQKLQMLRHAKQTLEYIDVSTSSTIIQANQIIVQTMKKEVNAPHLLVFISCLDHGLRKCFFNTDKWSEDSLKTAITALKSDSNLKILWKDMLTKMHVTHTETPLSQKLLFLFVNKFTKRRCVTHLAVDGLGPSGEQENSAIRQLLKKYDLLSESVSKTADLTINKSKHKCHGCGEFGHWVRECSKGYNKDWLKTQQCFKCGQHGHFRRDCPFKISKSQMNTNTTYTPKVISEPAKKMWYHPGSTLPKIIGMLNDHDLYKNVNFVTLKTDESFPETTKQRSDKWLIYRKGKINGSKSAVSLGWFGKPMMEGYWNQLRQENGHTVKISVNPEQTSKHEVLAMKWGTMCEDSAMVTHLFQFLLKRYPCSKVSETGVHIVQNGNGVAWLASSPYGLVNIEIHGLGVVEIKCPFMGGKPVPYRNVCVNQVPQIMLEMYATKTQWCHYVVWTPVGYVTYLVKRD